LLTLCRWLRTVLADSSSSWAIVVDLALGKSAQNVELARGKWARAGRAPARTHTLGKFVEDPSQTFLSQATGLGGVGHGGDAYRRILHVGDDHVGGANDGRRALGLVGVVALDGFRNPRVHAPASAQNPADEGVVDAQLSPLGVDAVLGVPPWRSKRSA
jgi:hypothetical protein